MNIVANLIKLGNIQKEAYRVAEELRKEGLTICGFYAPVKIQLYNGIDQVASLIGIQTSLTESADYKEKTIVLDGVIYLQLSSSLDGGFEKLEEVTNENHE